MEDQILVQFGEYLLSDERKALYQMTQGTFDGRNLLSVEERLKDVSHADLENFKASLINE